MKIAFELAHTYFGYTHVVDVPDKDVLPMMKLLQNIITVRTIGTIGTPVKYILEPKQTMKIELLKSGTVFELPDDLKEAAQVVRDQEADKIEKQRVDTHGSSC